MSADGPSVLWLDSANYRAEHLDLVDFFVAG